MFRLIENYLLIDLIKYILKGVYQCERVERNKTINRFKISRPYTGNAGYTNVKYAFFTILNKKRKYTVLY